MFIDRRHVLVALSFKRIALRRHLAVPLPMLRLQTHHLYAFLSVNHGRVAVGFSSQTALLVLFVLAVVQKGTRAIEGRPNYGAMAAVLLAVEHFHARVALKDLASIIPGTHYYLLLLYSLTLHIHFLLFGVLPFVFLLEYVADQFIR